MLPYLLLLPALVAQAPESVIPGAVEVSPGVFVLKGTPHEGLCAILKKEHIVRVIDLRRDEEPNLDCESEGSRLHNLGIQYMRFTVGRVPTTADFDFLRTLLNDLPRGTRMLIHCSNGNRAAAAVCPWLVLDRGMSLDQAFALAHSAGLKAPDTEAAIRKYLAANGRT
jgi:protein tyrosine phosphatase (PTP) superfamily phosphohydrolase (DUF442 family)